jgi:hypothetical protein
MKRRALALVTSLALAALIPGSTIAGTYVVDQSQTNTGTSIGGTSPIFAQTFTAGLYGQLESVDLYLYGRPATVAVSLQGVTGKVPVPDGTILGEKVVGVDNLDAGWVRFNFSNYPVVTPGQTYALFIYITGSTNALYGSVADLYPGGQALEYRDSAWSPISVRLPGVLSDWAFRTNVDPIPTPTPPGRLAPTPARTRAPIATRTPAPTLAPATPTTVPTPGVTPTPTTAAAASPAATDGAAPSLAPGSAANTGSGGSSGSGNLTFPIVGAAIVALVAGAGGLWFLVLRPTPPVG